MTIVDKEAAVRGSVAEGVNKDPADVNQLDAIALPFRSSFPLHPSNTDDHTIFLEPAVLASPVHDLQTFEQELLKVGVKRESNSDEKLHIPKDDVCLANEPPAASKSLQLLSRPSDLASLLSTGNQYMRQRPTPFSSSHGHRISKAFHKAAGQARSEGKPAVHVESKTLSNHGLNNNSKINGGDSHVDEDLSGSNEDGGNGEDGDSDYGENEDDDSEFTTFDFEASEAPVRPKEKDHSPTRKNSSVPGSQVTSRKRQRRIVTDSSDDSSLSQRQPRKQKKTLSHRRPTRLTALVDASDDGLHSSGERSSHGRQTRRTSGKEKGYNHYDYFEKPEGWHVKNPNPNVIFIEEIQKMNIAELKYPFEVTIRKGENREILDFEELQEFMFERGLLPTQDDIQEVENKSQGGVVPRSTTGNLTGLILTPNEPASAVSDAFTSPTPITESITAAIPVASQDEGATTANESLATTSLNYPRIDNTTAADIDMSESLPTVTLQKRLLAEVQEQAALTTKTLQSGLPEGQDREELAAFTYQLQAIMAKYNEAIKHTSGHATGTTYTEPTDQHMVSDMIEPSPAGQDLTPIRTDVTNNSKARRADSFSLDKSPSRLDHIFNRTPSKTPDEPMLITPPGHCVFCKEFAFDARLTDCNHVVCTSCFYDAQNEAYEATMGHPVCPACNASISKPPIKLE